MRSVVCRLMQWAALVCFTRAPERARERTGLPTLDDCNAVAMAVIADWESGRVSDRCKVAAAVKMASGEVIGNPVKLAPDNEV